MRRRLKHAPIKRRGGKGGGSIGMRDDSARRCLRESSPTLEFLAAQRGDRSPEFTGKIGKEVERAPFAPFLAHKQQWNVRAEQQERSEKIDRARIHERGQPLAKRPVADLVVVLQKVDE